MGKITSVVSPNLCSIDIVYSLKIIMERNITFLMQANVRILLLYPSILNNLPFLYDLFYQSLTIDQNIDDHDSQASISHFVYYPGLSPI